MIVCDICRQSFTFSEMGKISEAQVSLAARSFGPGSEPTERPLSRVHVCTRCDKPFLAAIRKALDGAIAALKGEQQEPAAPLPGTDDGLLASMMEDCTRN